MKGGYYANRRRVGTRDIETNVRFITVANGKPVHSATQALARIQVSAVSALTDNSGTSTADGTIAAIGNVTNAVVGTNDAGQKAATEAQLLTAVDAIKEAVAKLNAMNAKVPALDGTLVDSMTGTAVDGTVSAITVNQSGVGSSMASAAGIRTVITNITNRLDQLVYHTNRMAVACGQTPLVNNLGASAPSKSLTFAEVSTGTGTATSGSDTTDANAIAKVTDINAIMQKVLDAIKEILTTMAACRSATGGTAEVVAR